MTTKIFTTALFTTIAQAITTRESQADAYPFIESRTWEFMQVWQDRTISHTCSTSHDRVKSTPKFNLNTLHLVDSDPEKEEIIIEQKITTIGADVFAIEDPVPIPTLELDPALFEEIVIEIQPYESRCGIEPTKEYYRNLPGNYFVNRRLRKKAEKAYDSCISSDDEDR